MRLALIHKQFGGDGGLEKYLATFASRLLDLGHEIDVITSRIGKGAPETAVHEIPPLSFPRSRRLLHFNRNVGEKLASLEVDFSLGFGQTTHQDVHRAGGGCHAVYSRDLPVWKRLSPKNQIELKLERELYTGGRTRHFVVNASKVRDELIATYEVPSERITVIHTPVNSTTFHLPKEPKTEIRRRILVKTNLDLPAFLFVSLNHKRKGLDYLLDIWPDVNGELWIAGSDLDTAQLPKNVHFLGRRDDLPQLYQGADCFVHPTLYDACANTVLQAMASGLPSIVSANDGAIDFITDGETGFLLPSPSETGVQIDRFLALSGEERDQMAQNARNRVEPQTWEKHVAAWMEVLGKLD